MEPPVFCCLDVLRRQGDKEITRCRVEILQGIQNLQKIRRILDSLYYFLRLN